VADSFVRAGCWNLEDVGEFGRNYGHDLAFAIRVAECTRSTLLRFEDFATHPQHHFRLLYQCLSAREPGNLDELIAACSNAGQPAANPYEVHRLSSAEEGKWKDTMTASSVAALRRGSEEAGLDQYSGVEDWP